LVNNDPLGITYCTGPNTDTSTFVKHQFKLTGYSGNFNRTIFWKPIHGDWRSKKSSGGKLITQTYSWIEDMDLPCTDSIFLIVVGEEPLTNSDTGMYKLHPALVFSQAAANILHVASGQIPVTKVLTRDTSVCRGEPVQLNGYGGKYFQWNPSVGLNDPKIANPLAKPLKSTTYILNSYYYEGCSSSDSMHITVKNDDLLPNSYNPLICKGSSIILRVNGSFDRIKWNTGDTTAQISVSPSMAANYWYRADKNGCILVDTIKVQVINPPTASFIADKYNCPAGTLIHFKNQSLRAIKYNWDFGENNSSSNDSNPDHFFTIISKHRILLIATDSFGCKDTAISFITINDSSSLYIPSIFSPNGDNTNDLFEIKSTGIKSISCFIYNRWGELVTQNSTLNPGPNDFVWDGTFKGDKAPVGVYIYTLKAKAYDGRNLYKKGYITLER
jgi:gliding motility-associated-like protein